MFQGMFRKRGRPPEPPLQIGGYDRPSQENSNQIPAHQLRDAPIQLPLPAVREFEQSAIVQQEQPGFNNAIVESSSLQQTQHDVVLLDSHNRRLSVNPQHHTVCALVGDNRTEGLVVARLSTRHRTHLIVAVKEAKPLIPISYLIRIAHYRATWRMMGEHDCFQMKDGYGDPVMVNEHEDLLYVGKTTLWRIGYDLYNSASDLLINRRAMVWLNAWLAWPSSAQDVFSWFATSRYLLELCHEICG